MRTFISTVLVITAFILVSCSGSAEDAYDTIEAPSVTVTDHMEIKDTNDLIIGRISGVHVTSDGKILLADSNQNRIHLLGSDGTYLNSALREGRGPGEVQNMGPTKLTSDDRLLIHDWSQQRLSILEIENNDLEPVRDIPLEVYPTRFHMLPDGKLVFYETPSPGDGENAKASITIYDSTGSAVANRVWEFNRNEQLNIYNENDISMFSISSEHHPKNIILFHRDKMVYNRSDTLGFSVYDLNTKKKITEIQLNRPEVPLSSDEKREFVKELVENMGQGSDQTSRLISEMPETKGKVRNMHFDPSGKVWINIVGNEELDWLIFSKEGELIGNYTQPDEGIIIHIHNNHIFTRLEDEEGLPVLKVSKYKLNS